MIPQPQFVVIRIVPSYPIAASAAKEHAKSRLFAQMGALQAMAGCLCPSMAKACFAASWIFRFFHSFAAVSAMDLRQAGEVSCSWQRSYAWLSAA